WCAPRVPHAATVLPLTRFRFAVVARLAKQYELLTSIVPGLSATLAAGKEKTAGTGLPPTHEAVTGRKHARQHVAPPAALEKRYLARKHCIEMLPDADANLQRLSDEIATRTTMLLALADQWEAHRQPMLAAIQVRPSVPR